MPKTLTNKLVQVTERAAATRDCTIKLNAPGGVVWIYKNKF